MRVMVSMSGGLDSAVLVAHLLDEGHDVLVCNFKYPSKHNRYEMMAFRQLVRHYSLSHTVINVEEIFGHFKSNLLATGGPIPEGHYEAPSMTQTVVPGRNLIFASIMAGFAESLNIEVIALGVHAGDHHIYPDCRPQFIESLEDTITYSTEGRVAVWAPFLNMSKMAIVEVGVRLKVPFEWTRTCYKAQEWACGSCGSCTERLEAFNLNNLEDPAVYQRDIDDDTEKVHQLPAPETPTVQ